MTRVRNGVHAQLEAEADALLYESLKGVTSREAKSDILTSWKARHRETHEILSRTGTPIDPAVRIGIFNRAYNNRQVHLNSYDGPTRPMRMDSQWTPEDSESPSTMLSSPMQQIFGVVRNDD